MGDALSLPKMLSTAQFAVTCTYEHIPGQLTCACLLVKAVVFMMSAAMSEAATALYHACMGRAA